jgi:hypothetical protein
MVFVESWESLLISSCLPEIGLQASFNQYHYTQLININVWAATPYCGYLVWWRREKYNSFYLSQ